MLLSTRSRQTCISERASSLTAKFDIPICPHAGEAGLCEYVQHLSIFDYIAVSRR